MYKKLIETCYRKHGTNTTVTMIDELKNMGYKYSTLASVSFSIFDLTESSKRLELIEEADAVVRQIAEKKEGVVYMLWGSYAQKKGAMVDPSRNLVLKAVHPSPLSLYRGFFGSRHFSKANEYLQHNGQGVIEW